MFSHIHIQKHVPCYSFPKNSILCQTGSNKEREFYIWQNIFQFHFFRSPNVSVSLGRTATLRCRTVNVVKKSVSDISSKVWNNRGSSCTSTTLALAEFYTQEQIHPQTVAGLLIPFLEQYTCCYALLWCFFLQWQDLTFSWRRSLVQSKLPSSNVNLEWLGGFKADFREPLRQGDASPYPAKYPKKIATFKKSKSQTVSINVYVDFQPF